MSEELRPALSHGDALLRINELQEDKIRLAEKYKNSAEECLKWLTLAGELVSGLKDSREVHQITLTMPSIIFDRIDILLNKAREMGLQ